MCIRDSPMMPKLMWLKFLNPNISRSRAIIRNFLIFYKSYSLEQSRRKPRNQCFSRLKKNDPMSLSLLGRCDCLENDLTLVPEVRLRSLKKGKRSELNFRKIWLGCRHLRLCLGGQKRRRGRETSINPKIGAFLRGSRAPPGPPGHFQKWSFASFISGSMSHGP